MAAAAVMASLANFCVGRVVAVVAVVVLVVVLLLAVAVVVASFAVTCSSW